MKNNFNAPAAASSTETRFSPYTASPGTKLRVAKASSFPFTMNTPANGINLIAKGSAVTKKQLKISPFTTLLTLASHMKLL